MAGLPMAFLAAGVRAVVGTLWDIDSAASRHFFEAFYAQLAGTDADLRDAFAAAQRSTRTAYPEPRDWAAFYFLGDWR
jgi:CHAT domain-containing protein